MEFPLTHQRPKMLSYKNQSVCLCDKFIEWFLYDYNFGPEWVQDFFSKHNQIYSFLRICSVLAQKSLKENFISCAM